MPYIVTTKKEAPSGGLPHGEHPHDYGYPAISRRWPLPTLRMVIDAFNAREATR